MATNTEGAPEAAGATGAFWAWPVGTEIRDSCHKHRTGHWHHHDTFLPSFPQGKRTPEGNYKKKKNPKDLRSKVTQSQLKIQVQEGTEDNSTEENSGNYLLCCSSQGPSFSPHIRAAAPHSQAQLLTSCCLTLLGLLWCSELEEFISLA